MQMTRYKFKLCKLKNKVLFTSLGSKVIAEMQIYRNRKSRLP